MPMLVLASIYFGDIRKDVTLTSSRYWMMHVSMLTSAYMIAFKLGHVGPFIGRLREQKELERERTQLLASLGLDPLGASLPLHAAQLAGHGAAGVVSVQSNPAPMGFLVHPIVPILVAANLGDVEQEESDEVVEVRGVCPGCKHNVLSSDEGRKREGTVYFHLGCIKGMCPHCNKIVHADAERVNVSDEYWHRECATHIAGPSGSAH